MFKNNLVSIAFGIAVLFAISVSSSYAETLEQCMLRKATEASPATEKQIIDGDGCRSGGTSVTGERESCDSTLCWDSPPYYIIVDARFDYNSKIGSENWAKGPNYLPSKDAATKVCFEVHARSQGGVSHVNERGSTTINAFATIKKIPIPEEVITFARPCLQEGAN